MLLLTSGLGWPRIKLALEWFDVGVIMVSLRPFFSFEGKSVIASFSKACVLNKIDSLKKLSSSNTSLVFKFAKKTKQNKL